MLVISLIALLFICGDTLENQPMIVPDHFPEMAYSFDNNPINKEKIELGRALFFDPILSRDNSISCSSCHSPFNAFAHSDHALSHGIDDQMGQRNAPALFNLAWQQSFMWDGAINHLDMQALAPLSDPTEMDSDIKDVVEKLKSDQKYISAFQNSFNDGTISGENILKALAQFQLSLVSSNAKYDRVQLGLEEYTDQESKGYEIYQQHCASCHAEPLFSTYEFKNNGLPIDSTLNDHGRSEVTEKKDDRGLFKIPSLRNLSYSAPYMHDGRFERLYDVIDHYTDGIATEGMVSEELDSNIALTSTQKTDLVSFLLSLDDASFVFDTKHRFPKDFLLSSEGN